MLATKINWDDYRVRFTEKALVKNYVQEDIDDLLDYASILYNKNVPIIFDIEHFCLLVGYKESYVYRAIYNTENFYRFFEIPKKNGKYREIAEPLPSLKEIQCWILHNILYSFSASKYSKAYKKETSIKNNARFHKNQHTVLSLDIKNYFPSITIDLVIEFFTKIGYDEELALMLANLCCLNESLPQGAPTSPYLSNLLTIEIDNQLSELAISNNLRYTRYADDITFSGHFNVGYIINNARRILRQFDFEINEEKIRAQGRHQQQLVTGIVVNGKKMQVPRKKRMDIRQQMYYIQTYGLENHLLKRNLKKRNYLGYLLGTINYILHINPKDAEFITYRETVLNLMKAYN